MAFVGVAVLLAPIFVLFSEITGLIQVNLAPAIDLKFFLMTVLFYPLVEEIIFRGVIQHELLKVNNLKVKFLHVSLANMLSSTIFAIVHLVVFQNVYATLVFFPSIVFGMVYEHRKSLIQASLMHSWYNFVALFYVPIW